MKDLQHSSNIDLNLHWPKGSCNLQKFFKYYEKCNFLINRAFKRLLIYYMTEKVVKVCASANKNEVIVTVIY